MRRALTVADRLATEGIEIEVVDLRSLRPLDAETVCASVTKTSRALIAEEGWSTYGVGAELAARIQRACFDDLDAPVERVGGAEVPMPYAKPLELAALDGEDKIEKAAARRCSPSAALLKGVADGRRRVRCRASPTRWSGARSRAGLKNEGDAIAEGDVLAEIETDKATMELESLRERRPAEDPRAGGRVGRARRSDRAGRRGRARSVELPGGRRRRAGAGRRREEAPTARDIAAAAAAVAERPRRSATGAGTNELRASPIARRMAADAGLDLRALAGSGSGPDGRIVKVDVERALAGGMPAPRGAAAPPTTPRHAAAPARRAVPGAWEGGDDHRAEPRCCARSRAA